MLQVKKKELHFAAAVKMYSECDLLALIESCVMAVLKMGTLPSDKSIVQFGVTSFDLVNIINSVEEKLQVSFESGTANLLFECLLTVPGKTVAQSLLQIILHDIQGTDSCMKMCTETAPPISYSATDSSLKEEVVSSVLPFSPSTSSTEETLMTTSSAAKRPLSSLLSSDEGLTNSGKRVRYEESTMGTLSLRRGQSFCNGR